MISTLDLPARVERVALSDTTGEARMRVLVEDLGRSTIEDENNLDDPDGSARDDFEVAVRTLDSFQFDDVGFMKIDVEGHELAVLRGASETIGSNRPNLLVEVEDRHKPNATAEVFALMNGHRYRGYFLHAGDLHPVENFSLVDHQDASNIAGWREEFLRTGTYINNFVFVPDERSDAVLEAARRLLAQSR
jgi:FkbM family methyltransferase